MKIGVRAHDISKTSSKELVDKINSIGFDGAQLVLKKAICEYDFSKEKLNDNNTKDIANIFKLTNVFMLGAYFNPVHSNKEKVKKDMDYFKSCLKYASLFDCQYVGTETGSYNDDKWTYNPKNQTEDGFNESLQVFKELTKYAEEVGSNIALEGAWGHVMYAPKVLKKAIDELNSPNVFVTVDVFNYLYIGNYQSSLDILNECFELFGDKIKLFHLKDFVVEDGKLSQCALGKGIMPLNKMLPLIQKNCPNAYLIFEGSKEEDMKESLLYIRSLLNE